MRVLLRGGERSREERSGESGDIRGCSFAYLTAKDRTCKEMAEHLHGRGYTQLEISEEMDFLKDFRYLDDGTYSERFIQRALKKDKGLCGIEAELKNRGVEAATIEEAIAGAGIEDRQSFEKERACAFAEKYAGGKEFSRKVMAGIGRKLSSLGYDSEIVYHVIGKIMSMSDGKDE